MTKQEISKYLDEHDYPDYLKEIALKENLNDTLIECYWHYPKFYHDAVKAGMQDSDIFDFLKSLEYEKLIPLFELGMSYVGRLVAKLVTNETKYIIICYEKPQALSEFTSYQALMADLFLSLWEDNDGEDLSELAIRLNFNHYSEMVEVMEPHYYSGIENKSILMHFDTFLKGKNLK